MTKFKALFERSVKDHNGAIIVSFITSDSNAVQELHNLQADCFVDVQVTKHRKKRSLDANAYFHVLVSRIAEVQGLGLDEVKKTLVEEYGTVAFVARIPADADLSSIYKYSKLIGESKGTKNPCNDWYIFKPTHELNTAEMSRLIDNTVTEAKALGIETRTPNELADMMSLWEKGERK